ncbi:unnamed protein product [Euphydryas editha]|uniref:Protein AATF n=1 Tax=Euphydryas editha TaxID=104508 RepID=A0AAU9TQ76_EUPED|nr:unnamed protein product [Euphydryas editha]
MKLKQKKSKSLLSDKIADALTVKPRVDIEDDHVFNTKPNTLSRADFSSSDSEDEAAISDFKKRNVNLLSDISKKYEGKVVSRKEIEKNSDDDSSSDEDTNINGTNLSKMKLEAERSLSDSDSAEESDDFNITNTLKHMNASSDEESDGSEKDLTDNSDDGDEEDGDEEDEGEGYDISQMEEPLKEEFEHVKKQNISEEAKKGTCVRNQLLIWESLLEMRIHMQRCMNTANRMPMSETFNELKGCSEFADETSTTINNVSSLLDKFLSLQNMLLKKFPETKTLSSNSQIPEGKLSKDNDKESDEEIPSDTDNEEIPSDTEAEEDAVEDKKESIPKKTIQKKRKLTDYDSELATSYKAFKPFRDTTIQKWNEKTRLATAANIKNTPTNTILQQISFILSDRNKLIRRTQLKRSEYDIIGYTHKLPQSESNDQNGINPLTRDRKDNDEYIPEIFDDSDFYHQLLRELIECKSADITDPIQLSRQWIALQQLRSKMKRKVDTKATKGRKIKYVVHNKLVSYMAPEKSLKWNDESCNELYSSLFGKLFENNNVGINVNLENVETNKLL